MKRSFTVLLAMFILVAFTCGSALSVEKPDDKAVQAPAKIDKAKAGQNKEKIQSKDVKGRTEKNASRKTDKAYGMATPPPPPPIGPIGPGGKSTNAAK